MWNWKCIGGDSCFALGKSCNACKKTGHFAASKLCAKKTVTARKIQTDSGGSDSDSDDTLCRILTEEVEVSKAAKELNVSKAAKEIDVVTEANKKQVNVSQAAKRGVDVSKTAKRGADVSKAAKELYVSKAAKKIDVVTETSKKQVNVSKAAKRGADVSKAAKGKSDVVTEATRIGSNYKDNLGRIITVSKVKERLDVVTKAGRKPEDNNMAKVKMAAMEDNGHECSIRPITDTGVKKTILCRSDWAKIAKYGQVMKTATRFRPYGTSVQLPIRGKAKVYLKAQAGAVIELST